MGPRGDVLGPEVGLHAQYTALFVSRQHLERIERIDLLHRQITADGERFPSRIARLVIVQIAVRRRSHDGVVAHLRSLDAAFGAPPRHDRGRRRHFALQYLVPTDQPASVGVEEFLDAGRGIVLQPARPLQPLGLHARFAMRAFLPHHRRALVAADMDILRGEQLHHLGQYAFEEFESLLPSGAKHIVGHAPAAPHLVRTARAAQFGIGGQRRQHMARQVDFGNHRNTPVGGIFHHVADLVLRIETAVGRTVIGSPLLADHSGLADAAHGGQLRIALDLDAPALIVGQVPVQRIELVYGHHVDIPLHFVHREEVARHVEVHAPVCEPRRVGDLHAGHLPRRIGRRLRAVNRRRQQLFETLQGIEEAGKLRRPHFDSLPVHVQFIAFGRERFVRDETDARRGHLVGDRDGIRPAGNRRQPCGESDHGALRPLVGATVTRNGPIGHPIGSPTGFEMIGIGHDRDLRIVRTAGTKNYSGSQSQK